MVNGLKECAVRDAENESDLTFDSVASFSDVNAFRGYTLAQLAVGQAASGNNDRPADSCYAAQATGDAGNATFTIFV